MRTFTFTVPGKPMANPRHRTAIIGGHVQSYASKAQTTIHSNILDAFMRAGGEAFGTATGPVSLMVYAYYDIPKSWSKKRHAAALDGPMVSKPDFDNVGKTIGDALNKIAWADDSLIYDGHIVKRYAEMARMVVVIVDESDE